MKQWKKALSVCALLALLLAICVPGFSTSRADQEKTVVITISGTSECYGENGKQVGSLNYLNDDEALYQASGSKEEIPVIILYSYVAEDAGLGTDKLEGKVKVSLQLATPEENALNGTPDPNASPTPEIAATPQPELPSAVWVDASIVILAQSEALVQKDADIQEKDDLIVALQENGKTGEPEGSPTPTDEGISGDPNIEEKQQGLFQSSLFPIIALAVLFVIAGVEISKAISLARIAREKKKTNEEKNLKNQSLKSMDHSLVKLSERADTANAIKEAALDPDTNKPYLKAVVTDVAETRTILARIESKIDIIPHPQTKPETPLEQVERREVLDLANSLAGVASKADWVDSIRQAGYRYILVQTSPTDRDVLQEDRAEASILACLMKSAESGEAYLVPSFEDPSASEERWKDFYEVRDDAGISNFRVDELTVMTKTKEYFFKLSSKGKLSRRL